MLGDRSCLDDVPAQRDGGEDRESQHLGLLTIDHRLPSSSCGVFDPHPRGRESAREHIDHFAGLGRLRHQDVEEQGATGRDRVCSDMALLQEQDPTQLAARHLSHEGWPQCRQAGSAGCCDQQPAEQRGVAKLGLARSGKIHEQMDEAGARRGFDAHVKAAVRGSRLARSSVVGKRPSDAYHNAVMRSFGRQRRGDARCVARWGRRVVEAVGLAVLVSAAVAGAQTTAPGVQPELRTDVIVGPVTATEVAAGVAFPAGGYVRLGGDVGIGAVTGAGRSVRLGSRIDALGRFQLDPGNTRWGPYLVGGASYQADADRRGALYLLAAIGVHAPAVGGTVPAIEFGLGGGVRVGLVLTWR